MRPVTVARQRIDPPDRPSPAAERASRARSIREPSSVSTAR